MTAAAGVHDTTLVRSGRQATGRRPADLANHLLDPPWVKSGGWWALVAVAACLTILLFGLVGYTVVTGIGVWGNNIPVAWAFAIINFVWWIGIGHAGTFISAFLLLLNQEWRSSVSRLAETMTIFALFNAGLFPLLHLGRPWFFYWLVPYPARTGVWPNFKSALPWDIAAVTTYLIVSLLFWYLGMIPDLAAARDRPASLRRRRVYGLLALGWRGSGFQWQRRRVAISALAALAAPLVVSVHSVVSFDFSIAQLPGWHSTIFPPYFVVGAIYSGLAMVLVLAVPLRRVMQLHNIIRDRHLDRLAKLVLTTGLLLAYAYLVEHYLAWLAGDAAERYQLFVQRPSGPLAAAWWSMIVLNVLSPQLFWFRRLRRNGAALFAVGVAILIGMWLERAVIVLASLGSDFLPASWREFSPTVVDLGILVGSLGFFALLLLLFLRYVPAVAISEVNALRDRRARVEGAIDA